MPDLIIQIKKKTDGSSALSCRRTDGSVTWQRQAGRRGHFFPLHDLTHYAVETILGHHRGFYGLVAEGWALTDFGAPWPRGPIPPDAEPSELIVGFLDTERAAGEEWPASRFNDEAARFYTQRDLKGALKLTDEDLQRIRARMHELFALWFALPKGQTLELEYVRPIPSPSPVSR